LLGVREAQPLCWASFFPSLLNELAGELVGKGEGSRPQLVVVSDLILLLQKGATRLVTDRRARPMKGVSMDANTAVVIAVPFVVLLLLNWFFGRRTQH
jgi:hypothetical protein